LVVGEIGIHWREYLYKLEHWQIYLIIRGYYNRQHPAWERARLIAYQSAFAFGSKSTPPPVNEWLPFPWEHVKEDPLDKKEIEAIRQRIREENKKIGKSE